MRVFSTNLAQENGKVSQNNVKRSNLAFKTYNPTVAKRIEKEIAKKGIECHSKGNDFLADCCKKTVGVFENLFKKSYLPERLEYRPLNEYTYGQYAYYNNGVTFNSLMDNECFYNLGNLKREFRKNYISGWNSSNHPGHIFVHEFAHSTHWHHLVERNGFDNARKVWKGLEGTTVPTPIGRLITKFKISRYAVEGKDMCEFLAERMSQDICNGITKDSWIPFRNIDVNYENLFDRKWNYRYSSPQSYIDYFTQQVWNGDIEEAKKTGDLVEAYLAELEAERVSPTVQNVATKFYPEVVISKPKVKKPPIVIEIPREVETPKITETPKVEEHTESIPVREKSKSLLERFAQVIVDIDERITNKLDERNKIILRH